MAKGNTKETVITNTATDTTEVISTHDKGTFLLKQTLLNEKAID